MRAMPLLAALVLAGCMAPEPPSAEPQGLRFEPAQRLPGDRIGAEPNMAAHGADVWVIAVGSVLANPDQDVARGAVNLWHSPDRGATWERQRDPGPQDKNGTFCSCDTDVDLGPDGTLYLTDFWLGAGFNGFVVEASSDGGKTWGAGNPVTVNTPAGNDRQYVIAGRDPGEVYLAYAAGSVGDLAPAPPVPLPLPDLPELGAPGAQQGGLQLWRSTDAGRTLAQVAKVSDGGFIARPAVGPDGALFYGWSEPEPGDGAPWNTTATVRLAVSRDHGASFDAREVGKVRDGVGGLWPFELSAGPDGLLHLVWMERVPAGGSVLWYARSGDGGQSFAAPRVVGWRNGTALLPWVAHAGPGRAVVAWYGTEAAVLPLEAPRDTRWDAWAMVVGDTSAQDSAPARASPWPVKVGTFCPRGASCPQDRELLDYPAILWSDGWVHVAFAASLLDEGAGPPGQDPPPGPAREPRGGHSTNAFVYAARAALP
jgi:hypothetical protein